MLEIGSGAAIAAVTINEFAEREAAIKRKRHGLCMMYLEHESPKIYYALFGVLPRPLRLLANSQPSKMGITPEELVKTPAAWFNHKRRLGPTNVASKSKQVRQTDGTKSNPFAERS